MSQKKITLGEISSIPSTRSSDYSFWSIDDQTPLYGGVWGYAPGIDTDKPLKVTVSTPQYIDGMRCIPLKGIYNQNNIGLSHNYNTSGVKSTIYRAPVDSGISGQTVISLPESSVEMMVDGAGSMSLGNYDIDGGSNSPFELADSDSRYRLSVGLNDNSRRVSLCLENVSNLLGVNPLNISLGDETGQSCPVDKITLDNWMSNCSIGLHNPLYLYVKNQTIPLPTDGATGNNPVGKTQLFIRSNTTNGSTVITDSSYKPRSITATGVSHTTDNIIFGTSSILFENTSSKIEIANTDDALPTWGDFTFRCTLRTDKLGLGESARLFYLDPMNYLDLKDICGIEGYIAGVPVEGCYTEGDWNNWTPLCIMRIGSVICVSINSHCVSVAYSTDLFGCSSIYTPDVIDSGVNGTPFSSQPTGHTDGKIYTNMFDGNTATYYYTLDVYAYPVKFGYTFNSAKKITKYGIYRDNNTPAYTPSAWTFEGSNDGITWTILHNSIIPVICGTWNQYPITNNSFYTKYQLNISNGGYYFGARLVINEIEMYETYEPGSIVTSLIIGTNNASVKPSFRGNIVELQFAHTALTDTNGNYCNSIHYRHPGFDHIQTSNRSSNDRSSYLLTNEEYSLLKLTGMIATASSEVVSYEASKTIDTSNTTYWNSSVSPVVTLVLSSSMRYSRCDRYTLTIPAGQLTNAPVAWTFEGYNGSTWSVLDSRTGINDWTDGQTKTFDFIRPGTSYRSYRWNISAVNGGTVVCISNVNILDHSKLTLDQEYLPNTLNRFVSASNVRGGERHVSSNDHWTRGFDSESLASGNFVLTLSKPLNGRILIDNTGRLASSNALVSVSGLSWVSPPVITNSTGDVILYRFISSSYITSTTVTSNIILKTNLPPNELVWLDVDTGTTQSVFLAESDIFRVSNQNVTLLPYVNLSSKITGITINDSVSTISDGNITLAKSINPTSLTTESSIITDDTHGPFIRSATVSLNYSDRPSVLWISGGELTLNGTAVNTTYLFTPSTNTWSRCANCPMTHAGSACTTRYVNDDFVISLWNNKTLYEYNMGTNVWSSSISVTGSTDQIAVKNYSYTSYIAANNDVHIYMLGGVNGSAVKQSQLVDLNITTRTLSVITVTGDILPNIVNGILQITPKNGTDQLQLLGGLGDVPFVASTINIQNGSMRFTHGGGAGSISRGSLSRKVPLQYVTIQASFNPTYSSLPTNNDRIYMEMRLSNGTIFRLGITNGQYFTHIYDNGVWTTVIGTSGLSSGTPNASVSFASDRFNISAYLFNTTFLINTTDKTVTYFGFHSSLVTPGAYGGIGDYWQSPVWYDQFEGTNGTAPDTNLWDVNTDLSNTNDNIDLYNINLITGVSAKKEQRKVIDGITGSYIKDIGLPSSYNKVYFYSPITNKLYYLDSSDYIQTVGTISPSPTIGKFGWFNQIIDNGKNYILFGYGNVVSPTAGSLEISKNVAKIDITLDDGYVVRCMSLAWESGSTNRSPMQIRVEGFDGSWHTLSIISTIANNRSGNTYTWETSIISSIIRISCIYYMKLTPFNITGVTLFSDVRLGYTLDNAVDSYLNGSEILCPTVTTDHRNFKIPSTVFTPTGTYSSTTQTYIVKELGYTGLYQKISAIPSGYPYSTKYVTTDYTRMKLDINSLNRVQVLASSNVKLAFSFDNRSTWNVYNSGWTSIDITNESVFRTNGLSPSQVESIPLSAWSGYYGTDKWINVAVLLTLSSSSDHSYFSTIVWQSDDTSLGGRRILTPLDRWLNILLAPGTGSYLRSYTDVVNSVETKIVNCYDWSHGSNINNVQASPKISIDIQQAYTHETCDCMWVAVDANGNIPTKLINLIEADGSLLRGEGVLDYFDYTTETLSSIESTTINGSGVDYHRRAYGKSGLITFTYGGTTGYAELLDVSTKTLSKNVAQSWTPIRGNGATLAGVDNAWLTPGNQNLVTDRWYNGIMKVGYNNMNNYYDQRCSLLSSHVKGFGGVSNTSKGWVLGLSLNTSLYTAASLDYSNDTAGMTTRFSVDVSSLSSGTEQTIGVSSPTKTAGYFLIYRSYPTTSSIRPIVKLRYSTDTTHQIFRTDASLGATLSNPPNTQARSMGSSNVYWWPNNADQYGPTSLDISTDTVTRRNVGSNTITTNLGSNYCGAQSCGINY